MMDQLIGYAVVFGILSISIWLVLFLCGYDREDSVLWAILIPTGMAILLFLGYLGSLVDGRIVIAMLVLAYLFKHYREEARYKKSRERYQNLMQIGRSYSRNYLENKIRVGEIVRVVDVKDVIMKQYPIEFDTVMSGFREGMSTALDAGEIYLVRDGDIEIYVHKNDVRVEMIKNYNH